MPETAASPETDLPRILEITARLEFRRTEREYRLTASRQSGVSRLTWVTGDKTCPFCRYMEGKVVRSDDPRIDLLIPAHIGCECYWVEIGEREVGKLDWLDWDDPEFIELRDTHAHFATEPGKYEALRMPASPSSRDFIFRRGKVGEKGTREWKRPRYEERDDLIEAGVTEKGEKWRALGSDNTEAGPLQEGGSQSGAQQAAPLPAGVPAAAEPLPDRVRRSLQAFNSHLAGIDGYEESVTLRLDGSMVGRRRGRPGQTTFVLPPEGGADVVVSHNHEQGTSFSPVDFESASLSGVQELQAVWRGGGQQVTYRLQRPADGWPDVAEVREVLGSYEATWTAIETTNPTRDSSAVSHEVAQRVAARLGLRYTREQGPSR